MEMVTNYKQVGIIEGTSSSEINKYNVMSKQRAVQRSASQQKIERLRKSFENLIRAISKPEDIEEGATYLLDNPFSSETLRKDISLSIFSTPKKIVDVKERPVVT